MVTADHDQPAPGALLRAVSAFLREEVLPALEGHRRYGALVAANAVDIVAREIEAGDTPRHAERAGLAALLRRDGDLAGLTAQLCAEIAAERLDEGTPGLIAHLRAATLTRLAVDQPAYATYRRRLGEGLADPSGQEAST